MQSELMIPEIKACEDDCIAIIENFGEGMSRSDAIVLFNLLKQRIEEYWIDIENRSFPS